MRMVLFLAAFEVAIPRSAALADFNFPPTAVASASAREVLVGDTIRFSAAASTDPDSAPGPLTFTWELGDGTASTSLEPEHAYSRAGAYPVTLTVDDGADTAVDVIVVYILERPTSSAPVKSTPIEISPGGRELWVANEDAASVSVFSIQDAAPALSRSAEIPVGKRPRSVSFSLDGLRAYAAEEDDNRLSVIDARGRRVLQSIAVGKQPRGMVTVPTDGRLLVALSGEGRVAVLEAATLSPRASIEVADMPCSLAVTHDGRIALVSHLLSPDGLGRVSVIDLARESLERIIELPPDPGPDTPSSGRGVPNLLGAIAIEPGGSFAWIGGLKSNTARGLLRDGLRLGSINRVRGMLAKLDLLEGSEVSDRRIDLNNADSGSAVAFSANGRYAYVTHQGLGSLSVYDLAAATLVRPGEGSTVPFLNRIDVGEAPRGVVVSSDGRRAYVLAALSREVILLDLTNPSEPLKMDAVKTTNEPLPASVANGKRLFFRSAAPRHSSAGYIACASCHPDGGHDGQTWDFTDGGEGLRNTIDLRGKGGTAQGPLHWTANFDEVQDFENDIVNAFGGTGLAADGEGPHPSFGPPNAGRSSDLDDLAAFVASLTSTPPSPYRLPSGALSPAALLGREVFFREETGCAGCHVPPEYTDSTLAADPSTYVLHDVGTLGPGSGRRLGGELRGLDTPTLKGLWATAPYLHDGSAPSLQDVLTSRNTEDRHGKTSTLSAAEIDDLVAFLLSLDDRPLDGSSAIFRRGDSNCDARIQISDAVFTLDWLFLGGAAPCCLRSADANGNGAVDISDAVFTLTWLFLGLASPPDPGPTHCGPDPGISPFLPCDSYPVGDC